MIDLAGKSLQEIQGVTTELSTEKAAQLLLEWSKSNGRSTQSLEHLIAQGNESAVIANLKFAVDFEVNYGEEFVEMAASKLSVEFEGDVITDMQYLGRFG